jgi:hypothetical protein
MQTTKHITRGIRLVHHTRPLVAIAFIFKLGLSFLFLVPLQSLISSTLSHRQAATVLLTSWNPTPIIDFIFNTLAALKQYTLIVLVGAVLTLILHLFLSGGFFRTLVVSAREDSPSLTLEGFFGRCGKYFSLFLKIAFLSGIFYCAAATVFIILSDIGTDILLGTSPSEPMQFLTMLIQAVMLMMLLLFIHMGATYMKIIAAEGEGQRLYSILNETVLFLRRHSGKAVVLYGALLVGLILIMGLYWFTSRVTGRLPTSVSILGLFLLQQSVSFIRSWYRLVGYASQIRLYTSN